MSQYVKHNITGRVWKVTGSTYQPKTGWTLYCLESPDGIQEKAKKDSYSDATIREAQAAGFIILDKPSTAPKGEASTADKGKLIERIQKLLRLANNAGATEAEAQSAMAKVHELLAEHNLTMAAIESHGQEKDEVLGKKVRTTNKNGKWECYVYQGAAKLNFCEYAIGAVRGSTDINHLIIGTEVNVLAAELLGDYLRDTCNRMARELDLKDPMNAALMQADKVGEAMFRHKFKQGMADRLEDRCLKLREQRSRAATKTTDGRNLPALLSTYAAAETQNKAFLDQEMGDVQQTSHKIRGGYSTHLGRKAAETVSLETQVGTTHDSKARRIG